MALEDDNNWAKMSRTGIGSVRKQILDALGEKEMEESIGKPDEPALPLFGSVNVDVNNQEELGDE